MLLNDLVTQLNEFLDVTMSLITYREVGFGRSIHLSNGHQTHELQLRTVRKNKLSKRKAFFGETAALPRWLQAERGVRLLATGMNFYKHVEGILALGKTARGIQLFRQLDAVHTLDHPEVRNLADELIALSALQVSDQVPLDVLGEDLRLVHQLLHIVFSKVAMAIVVEFLDVLGRLLLAHSNDAGLSGQKVR